MKVIIDIQGFKRPVDDFVLKELGISSVLCESNDEEVNDLIMFETPCKWEDLPDKYQKMNSWLTKNFHGLDWNQKEICQYSDLDEVLAKLLRGVDEIFVKGVEKKKLLSFLIGDTIPIVNLEDFGCPQWDKLGGRKCLDHTVLYNKPHFSCAQENLVQLKTWYIRYVQGCLEKSLKAFCKNRNLKDLTTEEFAFLPKFFLLEFARQNIGDVWDKLPKHLQRDPEMKPYKRCMDYWNSSTGDQLDGPPPLVMDCALCQFLK